MNEVRIYRPVIRKEAAAPKTAISLEETGQRLTPDRLRQDVNSINSYHRREQTLLDKTQKMEIEKLKQQTEKEIRVAPPQEKQRKLKELQARIEQLRQQHGEEKEQLLQRQAREKQSIKPENLRNKNH